ncbi:MAG: amino acid adenylation domain-containing protein, partial [Candidatus Aminicenantes bacterium]
KIIGMFVNTLALRIYPSGEKKFTDFLEEVKGKTLRAFENQDYQYEDLVEEVSVTRDASRNPLFDTMFVLQNTGIQSLEIPALKVVPYEYTTETSKFDLTLIGVEVEEKLVFTFEYRTGLFKDRTIERFITYFTKLVKAVLENKHRQLSGIEIIPEAERNLVLYEFNSTGVEFPKDKTIKQLFEEQVEKTPDHVALVGNEEGEKGGRIDGKKEGMHLSYWELNQRSHQLTRLLKEKEVKPDTIVGIMIGRSVEMIVGILGILKAGGAYLPINPDYPEERIHYMLEDSASKILVTTPDLSKEINFEKEIIYLSDAINRAPTPHPLQLSAWVKAPVASLAYVIYTSGSTGKPKGVMVEHRNAVNVVTWFGRTHCLGPHIHVLQMSDYTFDASVNQIFGTLLHGAVLYVIHKDLLLDSEVLRQYIETHRIHVLNFIPMMLNELLSNGPMLKSIHVVLSGGERLDNVVKDNILEKGYVLYNQYGPTETTIDALVGCCTSGPVTLGTPISNTRCYIFDKYQKLAPVGAAGELYIGGAGVARGYLNRPELTAEKFGRAVIRHSSFVISSSLKTKNRSSKFFPNHQCPMTNDRLYRTGDLARWLANGEIEFLGRVDQQVKIRGYRVELGEIESHLLKHNDIKEAVVIDKEEETGTRYLCAYIVSGKGIEKKLGADELKKYLSKRLPGYMVPAYFMHVERIPLTSNGKIDRKALPEPQLKSNQEYKASRDELEGKMVDIWSEILGIERENLGIDTNFFEAGGHSLNATVLVSKIHKKLNVKVSLAEFFKRPVIRDLADFIKEVGKYSNYCSIEPASKKEYYELSSSQKRMYLLWQTDPKNTVYNTLKVLMVKGELDKEKLKITFKKLIKRHESFRTSILDVSNRFAQKIHDEVDFEIEYYNSKEVEVKVKVVEKKEEPPTSLRSPQPAATLINSFIRPFDLTKAPLIRVGLIKIEEKKHILMIDMHHIISDGLSLDLIVKEFENLYKGRKLPKLLLQYKDYAEWQNSEKQKQTLKKMEEYWLKEFGIEGEIPVLNMPIDYVRPAVQSFEGDTMNFGISVEDTGALRSVALGDGSTATMYMVLLSIFNILLSKLSGQEDIVMGTPIAGRRHADLEKIIGMFVNTLALRHYPEGEKTFKEFLKEVKERTLEAFENQDYPFEDLVEKVAVTRDASRNPLFDVLFALQNIGAVSGVSTDSHRGEPFPVEVEIPGLKMEYYDYINSTSKFDLALIGTNAGERLLFTFQYCTKLFKKKSIERFIDYFKKIVSLIVKEPGMKLRDIEIISGEEKRQLLYDFNDTKADYPQEKTIHELFAEEVEKTPDKIALTGIEHGAWSRAGSVDPGISNLQLTYRQLNERSNQLAGVLREKGVMPEAIVAILLKRSLEMIIGIMGVLKAGGAFIPLDVGIPRWRLSCILKDSGCKMVLIDKNKDKDKKDAAAPGLAGDIPTSISILAVSNHPELTASGSREDLESVNRLWDLACVLYESDASGFPRGMMVEHQGLVNLVKGIKREYTDGRQWLEVLSSPVSLQTFLKERSIYKCYILDSYINPVPMGTEGEIYVGGIGVCRGYLNRPGLTWEKFIRDPFVSPIITDHSDHSSMTQLLHRTGDMGRYLADGHIAVTGRKDDQLEIQGRCVQLGEIRFHIMAYEGMRDAVVVLDRDQEGEEVLRAYYVNVKSPGSIDVHELKEFLSERLPAYMIPMNFIQLEELPLTSTGHLDRSALPVPGSFVGPGNEIERKLSGIWSKILGVEKVGVTADFFQLGGNSIKALLLVSELNEVFNVNLLITHIFEYTTIEKLSAYLAELSVVSSSPSPIEKIEKRDYYDISHAQRRLWVLCQFEESSVAYNMPGAYILKGALNREAFGKAFEMLVRRHESLRTVFITIDDEPKQRILGKEEIGFKFKEIDLRKDAGREKRAKALADEEAGQVFNLGKGPLISAKLLQLEDEKYLFLLNMHHIISDGWSMGVLVKEVCMLYNAALDGKESSLLPLKIQYKDFSAWQNKQLEGEGLNNHRGYWQGRFKGEVPVLELSCDYPRPKVKTYNGDRLSFLLPSALSREAIELSQCQGTSLFILLLATVKALLYRYTGQEDLVIGSPISGRQHRDLEEQIGFYVNTLALRTVFEGRDSFEVLLGKVKETSLAAYDHELYPFDQLVDDLELARDTSHSPLFDVMVSLNPEIGGIPAEGIEGVTIEGYEVDSKVSKFDLLFVFTRLPEGIYVALQYNTDLFNKTRILRMGSHYQELLRSIVKDIRTPLNELNYLSDEEKHQLLVEFNNNKMTYSQDKTLHELFEEQVERTPDHIAVMGPISDIRTISGVRSTLYLSLSYLHLNRKSDQLAKVLRKKGVKPGNIVGILPERSVEMIVGILAILKAGGAYLPIDPEYPEERIKYMLADSNAKVLVTTSTLAKEGEKARIDMWEGKKIFLEDFSVSSVAKKQPAIPNPQPTTSTTRLAYVIYTSGSTGKPKGVLIQHISVVNLAFSQRSYFDISAHDRILQFSSICFDASVEQIFITLFCGALLVLIDKDTLLQKDNFEAFIASQSITHLHAVPSFLNSITLKDSYKLKRIISGGDVCPVPLAKKLSCYCDFYNEYGPTETTVTSIEMKFEDVDENLVRLPIGKPLSNTTVYLFDRWLKLVPLGVRGELYIGGEGVGLGYLNKPELTAESFVYLSNGERVYRTGDVARWLPDGIIEFLGRVDHQVKIRGFRIELGEIESKLLDMKDITGAIVVEKEGEVVDNKYLCAYIVSEIEPEISELREYLLKYLPDYMIPSHFMHLKKIPLTVNRKVDRDALPNPQFKAGKEYAAPGDELEEELVKIWSELLGIEKDIISIDANFFELGGHSLKATMLAAKINRKFDILVPLVEIYQRPTVKKLGEYIRNENVEMGKGIDNLVLLRKEGVRANNLFFIHDGSGEVEGYIEFCNHLTNAFNCWGIKADSLKNHTPANLTIEGLANKYIARIKRVQPHGPYYIAGWSLGGTIAFEMARRLEQMKEEILFLALIDSPGPDKPLKKHVQKFTLESELKFVQRCLRDYGIKKELRNISKIEQIWPKIIEYLEKRNIDVEEIKKLMVEYGMQVVRNHDRLGVRESISYLNTGRALANARALYIPGSSINTTLHYFKANHSKEIFKKRWDDYCFKPIKSYEIPGDHYSIFKEPEVAELAEQFTGVLLNLPARKKHEPTGMKTCPGNEVFQCEALNSFVSEPRYSKKILKGD